MKTNIQNIEISMISFNDLIKNIDIALGKSFGNCDCYVSNDRNHIKIFNRGAIGRKPRYESASDNFHKEFSFKKIQTILYKNNINDIIPLKTVLQYGNDYYIVLGLKYMHETTYLQYTKCDKLGREIHRQTKTIKNIMIYRLNKDDNNLFNMSKDNFLNRLINKDFVISGEIQ